MRVFWWQDGLHFEPETKEERTALALLLDSIKVHSIANVSDSTVCTSILREHGDKVFTTNTKL